MSYFFDPETRTKAEPLPGVALRTFWGERMLMSLVDLAPGAVIPEHSHPHEQVGMMLRGEMRLTIAGEARLVKPGDIYIVPGGVVHSVVMGDCAAQCIEAFAPVREEYKFPD